MIAGYYQVIITIIFRISSHPPASPSSMQCSRGSSTSTSECRHMRTGMMGVCLSSGCTARAWIYLSLGWIYLSLGL
jgi:hypothetical protein